MQFVSNQNGDPICLDFERPTKEGDYPVVGFNHDVVPREAWRSRETLRPYAQELAPSFCAFFGELCFSPEKLRHVR
jgi:hypothetical protein